MNPFFAFFLVILLTLAHAQRGAIQSEAPRSSRVKRWWGGMGGWGGGMGGWGGGMGGWGGGMGGWGGGMGRPPPPPPRPPYGGGGWSPYRG
ncbi:unnamed protein product [Toxocara canis]|uniref:Uncharacterized protein n=1 Tax=Toxocara canis TaxID=6265 RepID=A0A183TYR2_TOXCA|nr:unnamed protein product [Toxocara canis]